MGINNIHAANQRCHSRHFDILQELILRIAGMRRVDHFQIMLSRAELRESKVFLQLFHGRFYQLKHRFFFIENMVIYSIQRISTSFRHFLLRILDAGLSRIGSESVRNLEKK